MKTELLDLVKSKNEKLRALSNDDIDLLFRIWSDNTKHIGLLVMYANNTLNLTNQEVLADLFIKWAMTAPIDSL